ncbi:hypothetical protein CPC08DRAFT_720000 [Agrocybe pediades]|nr:hypothetical protein CPC08DRAFT_720000 [Agrocybe pediades]
MASESDCSRSLGQVRQLKKSLDQNVSLGEQETPSSEKMVKSWGGDPFLRRTRVLRIAMMPRVTVSHHLSGNVLHYTIAAGCVHWAFTKEVTVHEFVTQSFMALQQDQLGEVMTWAKGFGLIYPEYPASSTGSPSLDQVPNQVACLADRSHPPQSSKRANSPNAMNGSRTGRRRRTHDYDDVEGVSSLPLFELIPAIVIDAHTKHECIEVQWIRMWANI